MSYFYEFTTPVKNMFYCFFREIQVYQEHLVAKEQKDHEDLLGSLAWMVQLEKKYG